MLANRGKSHQGFLGYNHNLCPGAIFSKKFFKVSAGKIINVDSRIMKLPDNAFSSGKQDKMAGEKA
jgi:hypothetical protein